MNQSMFISACVAVQQNVASYRHVYIRYDTIEEFNVDSKSECDQLNLAHETKTKNASAQLVQYRFKIREGRPEVIRVTMEARICERDEFQVWSERSRE